MTMPLGPSTVRELTTELLALEKRKHDIDERIAAIQLLLKRTPTARRAASAQPELTFNGDGLRGALKKVLGRGPQVPKDVIKALTDAGFEASGKTPIATRVYNELGRMKRDGLTQRDPEGRYALAS